MSTDNCVDCEIRFKRGYTGPCKMCAYEEQQAKVTTLGPSDALVTSPIGIPYAKLELLGGKAFVTCPKCSARIQLHERKDRESWTGIEYAKHYEVHHAGTTEAEAAREFAYADIGRVLGPMLEVLHMTDRDLALRIVRQIVIAEDEYEKLCVGLDGVGAGAFARDLREYAGTPKKRAPRARRKG